MTTLTNNVQTQTWFGKKTSFLALLEKNFSEKLSGLSVKGGGGAPTPFR